MASGHYSVQDNGTSMVFLTDDSRHSEHVDNVRYCETEAEFNEWAMGQGGHGINLACHYDDEYYIKVKVSDDGYETMTLSEANEYVAEQEGDESE